jgi:hypothetical protein
LTGGVVAATAGIAGGGADGGAVKAGGGGINTGVPGSVWTAWTTACVFAATGVAAFAVCTDPGMAAGAGVEDGVAGFGTGPVAHEGGGIAPGGD